MRRTRRLLLLLIVLIAGGVGITYNVQRQAQAKRTPPVREKLPDTVTATASNWSWRRVDGNRPVVEVEAKDYRARADNSRLELDGVELKLYHKDGAAFDRVKSAKAEYDPASGVLFSEGDVEITMGVPADQKTDNGRLVQIKTSGVKFDSKTGKAATDRAASFRFDRGEGQATGAEYNPQTRELQMHSDVKLVWRGTDPKAKPMEVEAGSLAYKEVEAKIFLSPWSKFKRDTLNMEAGSSVVTLNKDVIQLVEAQQARGTDVLPERQLQYGADGMRMMFNDDGVIENIIGEQNARVVSTAKTAVTTVTSKRVDMHFDAASGESVLQNALANGGTVVEAKPVPKPGTPQPDTRILKSEAVLMSMRPGGKDIDKVVAQTPGQLEFVPNRPDQKHRILDGEHMTIQYGDDNQMQSFRASNAKTRTDPLPPAKGKPQLPPAITSSKELAAEFEPKSGTMQKLQQWDSFLYEEGERKAKAQRAELDATKDLITLNGSARAWDQTGSTSADTIVMNQKTSDFEAIGNVNSTRLPDKKKDSKQSSPMLSGDEPMQAMAARMVATENRSKVEYFGNALLWQGANRVRGDRVLIDRKSGSLRAFGNVFSQLLDKADQKDEKGATKSKAPVFTIVKSTDLIYSDKDRIAHYKGGTILNRANMVVTSKELRAFLKQGESDSSFDKAFADGDVKVVQTTPERVRTGTSDHAEFYSEEGKTILNGGTARLVDSVKGTTVGKQLTYFTDNDRLLVEGGKAQPVQSNLRKK